MNTIHILLEYDSMYHHFKGNQLSRSEAMQRMVVEKILTSPLLDDQRESSKIWELKHSSTCLQIGRILALKRGLDIELAEIICVLHDIAVIETGMYQDHARKGAKIARELLRKTGGFTEAEITIICDAIAHHSEKDQHTEEPYRELIKDADVYDCSLYEGSASYYKEQKPPQVSAEYFKRVQKISEELGVPVRPDFIL